jgi:hypothetical protein
MLVEGRNLKNTTGKRSLEWATRLSTLAKTALE